MGKYGICWAMSSATLLLTVHWDFSIEVWKKSFEKTLLIFASNTSNEWQREHIPCWTTCRGVSKTNNKTMRQKNITPLCENANSHLPSLYSLRGRFFLKRKVTQKNSQSVILQYHVATLSLHLLSCVSFVLSFRKMRFHLFLSCAALEFNRKTTNKHQCIQQIWLNVCRSMYINCIWLCRNFAC